jgi:peptide/nickel transport system ATP-binding protein
VQAVSNVTFDLPRGETLGIVGESGCGKSSLAQAILSFVPVSAGQIVFDGIELTRAPSEVRKAMRRRIQMVFQDPASSLNPRRAIFKTVLEPLRVWKVGNPAEREAIARRTIEDVGLDPDVMMKSRPSMLSGGECQRICLARALVLGPSLLVCDEAVSALDVSVKGQVINLLDDLKSRHDLSLIFISHDLAVVKTISDRIGVIYLGRLCEFGAPEVIFTRPAHHYTKALIGAIPQVGSNTNEPKTFIEGEIPSPLSPPSGCRFRTRCPAARERCAVEAPELRDVGSGQLVACHYPLVGDEAR